MTHWSEVDRWLDEAVRAENSDAEPGPDPDVFMARLRRRIARESEARPEWPLFAGMAAALLLGAVLWLLGRVETRPEPGLDDGVVDGVVDGERATSEEQVIEELAFLEVLGSIVADKTDANPAEPSTADLEDLELCAELPLLQDDELEQILDQLLERSG